jgi:hypothetical protein
MPPRTDRSRRRDDRQHQLSTPGIPAKEHAHRPRRITTGSSHLLLLRLLCVIQHAPGGVNVQDLRPLRGRPCGPIPDTDAYPGAPTDDQKKVQQPNKQVDQPRPFRDDLR